MQSECCVITRLESTRMWCSLAAPACACVTPISYIPALQHRAELPFLTFSAAPIALIDKAIHCHSLTVRVNYVLAYTQVGSRESKLHQPRAALPACTALQIF